MLATCATQPCRREHLVRRVNQIYHDLTQDIFDAEHRYRHRVERRFWAQVVRQALAAAPAGRTVVDLACGTGFVSRLCEPALRANDTLIAVDVSTQALHTVARRWSQDCKRRPDSPRLLRWVADGQRLPLARASVDLVAMNAGLHHVPEPDAALREIDRVLKPGGWFALGFEPNIRHFASPLVHLSRGFDRLAWYASPRQNVRRVGERLGVFDGARAHAGGIERMALTRVNRELMHEGLIDEPLSAGSILDLVDPHARGAETFAGFDAASLLRRHFAGYRIVRLITSDYLGESARYSRLFRGCTDAALRMLWPAQGVLFSWLIRKPACSGEKTMSTCQGGDAHLVSRGPGGDRS